MLWVLVIVVPNRYTAHATLERRGSRVCIHANRGDAHDDSVLCFDQLQGRRDLSASLYPLVHEQDPHAWTHCSGPQLQGLLRP